MNRAHFRKLFEGEMLIRIQSISPLQIFNEFAINSGVIFKSILDPDNILHQDLLAWMGYAKLPLSALAGLLAGLWLWQSWFNLCFIGLWKPNICWSWTGMALQSWDNSSIWLDPLKRFSFNIGGIETVTHVLDWADNPWWIICTKIIS